MTKNKGFTFIELVIVVLLISILITFVTVNWHAFIRQEGVTFIEQLSIEVSMVREDALTNYQTRILQFDLTNNTIESGVVDLEKGFEVFRKITIPSGFNLIDAVINGNKVAFGVTQMRFLPTGLSDKTILHFEGTKEGWLTIIIWPLTGRLETHNEYVDEIKLNKGNNPS